MNQLEQNQAALQEEVSQVRSQIGHLMKIIQGVARGQEMMAKMQEEVNQHAHISNPPVVENTVPPPQGNPSLHIQIGAPDGVPPTTLNPPVIEIDDQ